MSYFWQGHYLIIDEEDDDEGEGDGDLEEEEDHKVRILKTEHVSLVEVTQVIDPEITL